MWENSIPQFAGEAVQGAKQVCQITPAWNYDNTSCWGLSFPRCSTGLRQSPIHINSSLIPLANTGRDKFLAITSWHPIAHLRVANTGMSLQVLNQQIGYVTLMGDNGFPQYYEVTNFVLRMPSEHFLNGRQFAAELQVYHKKQITVKTLNGSDVMVASIFFDLSPNDSPLLRQLYLNDEPLPKLTYKVAQKPIDLLRSLGPALDGDFFHYDGSLTQPDCSESVKWFVFAQPLNMSLEQWSTFKAMYPNPGSNRPVQPLNGRTITKNSLDQGTLKYAEYYLRRDYGMSRPKVGEGFIFIPVSALILLTFATMYFVFVREDKRRKLEGSGGLAETIGRGTYNRF